jgi:hypothetical protein
MAIPLITSAIVGASVSFLVAVLFNSLRSVKSDKKGTSEYPHQNDKVWE